MSDRAAAWILGLVAFAFAEIATAQSIVVSGVVRSDSKVGPVVANAEVSIVPGPNPVRTDSAGRFRVTLGEPGPALLTVRAIGFTRLESTVEIDGPDSARVDVVIHPTSTVLEPVVVKGEEVKYISPALRGFEERRHMGFGRFVTEETLRKMDNRQLADVLSGQVPGARVIRVGSRALLGTTRTTKQCVGVGCAGTSNKYCYATIYVDGVLRYDMQITRTPPPDLSDFAVDQLGGLEYYGGEATAPPGYRHSGCGLALLWTRER